MNEYLPNPHCTFIETGSALGIGELSLSIRLALWNKATYIPIFVY